MDFRFIAAGILVGTVGFVGGSTMFADASQPSDPAIASLAAERQAAYAAAGEIRRRRSCALPKAPKIPVVPPAPKPRVVVIRLRSTPAAAASPTTAKAAPKKHHEPSTRTNTRTITEGTTRWSAP